MKTINVSFYLRKDRVNKKTGEAPLRMRISVDTQRIEMNLNRKVKPKDWDENIHQAKSNKEWAQELNRFLDAIKQKVYKAERMLLEMDSEVTPQAIQYIILDKNKEHVTYLNAFESHNEDFKQEVEMGLKSPATLEKFERVKKFFLEYLQYEYRQKDIELRWLESKHIFRFDRYLRSVRKIANNTTVKYVRTVKKIVFYSIRMGWINQDPFAAYDGKINNVDRQYLDMKEINAIEEKVFSSERLNIVKDCFLLACYTGLAYIDIKNLTNDHIQQDKDGRLWIKLKRTKTKVNADIPIIAPALKIIKKYENHPVCVNKGVVIPCFSNQKVNAYLKEIADACEIQKVLTFHIGRHSFASTIALENGISLEVVRSMLGHKNIQMTEHYAKMSTKRIAKEIEKVDLLYK